MQKLYSWRQPHKENCHILACHCLNRKNQWASKEKGDEKLRFGRKIETPTQVDENSNWTNINWEAPCWFVQDDSSLFLSWSNWKSQKSSSNTTQIQTSTDFGDQTDQTSTRAPRENYPTQPMVAGLASAEALYGSWPWRWSRQIPCRSRPWKTVESCPISDDRFWPMPIFEKE